jgi:hypothetical protein
MFKSFETQKVLGPKIIKIIRKFFLKKFQIYHTFLDPKIFWVLKILNIC